VNPGDRAEVCKGMMEPILVEVSISEYDIIHRCIVCGSERRNKVASGDNFELLIQIAAKHSVDLKGKIW